MTRQSKPKTSRIIYHFVKYKLLEIIGLSAFITLVYYLGFWNPFAFPNPKPSFMNYIDIGMIYTMIAIILYILGLILKLNWDRAVTRAFAEMKE